MERLFYKKWTSAIFVAAILILVLLLCMLLVTLTQMSSLKTRADALVELIERAKQGEEEAQRRLDEMGSDDYVIRWAVEHGRINEDDISWINSSESKK